MNIEGNAPERRGPAATMDRGAFLRRSALAIAGASALSGLVARNAAAAPGDRNRAGRREGGYGPLRPTPAENTGEVLLALPEGFRYTAFGRAGAPMSDGNPTPPSHDGMAAFAAAGAVRLVRNHEVRDALPSAGDGAYDTFGGGGTTTLMVDPETRLPERDFVSLSGTAANCAGGPTPWGSWLTCEETSDGEAEGFGRDHGYVFEVPSAADGPVEPEPMKAMGRFRHEAAAVDPGTGVVYETEDRQTAGFYRFLPDEPGDLKAGGRLQMLAIKGRPNYDTRAGQRVGKPLPVTWVDIEDPDPAGKVDPLAVYGQGQAKGAATFARLEGCWYDDGSVFINATSGGDEGLGQVWEYRPRGDSGGQLVLLFESTSPDVLDSPDNVTVSPRGGLVLCEDPAAEVYLRGLTRRGQIFDFAKNAIGDGEFAGATFGPDGETLFVNVQDPGVTFGIWGPWEEGAL